MCFNINAVSSSTFFFFIPVQTIATYRRKHNTRALLFPLPGFQLLTNQSLACGISWSVNQSQEAKRGNGKATSVITAC